MDDNQVIHEWVMGGCYHKFHRYFRCMDCGEQFTEANWLDNSMISYSYPTNYEALSSKFREWGEWAGVQLWLTDQHNITTLRAWENVELVDRIPLIADYIRSKGPDYWKGRREV